MSLIKIFENDSFIVDYNKENKRYRVSYFEDGHYQDDCWFDGYEDKETSLSEVLEKYELLQCRITEEEFKVIIDTFCELPLINPISSNEIRNTLDNSKENAF